MVKAVGIDPKSESGLTWPVKLDGEERQLLEVKLQKDIADETERTKIFLTAASILGRCPSPTAVTGEKTGLALGKVQSGKTSSFIGLTALAFDNGYRAVIVLAGTKTNLVGQNTGRIREQLVDGRSDRKIAVLTTLPNPEKGVRVQDVAGILKTGNNVLITVLKHPKHIAHLATLFSSSEINHYPVLIIDDEGDQASPNTKVRKREQSETFKQIVNLRKVFKLHAYVAYTATPQANLLIDTINELSPQFCVLIEPGKGYTGGSTFHGPEQKKFVREIPDNEVGFGEEGGVPGSFIRALSVFYVGACIRKIRGDTGYHSMLVHTSQRKAQHEEVCRMVEAVVESWRQKLVLPETDPARKALMTVIKQGYDDLCPDPTKCPTWAEVSDQLRSPTANPRIWIVNSSDLGDIPTTDNLFFQNNIFIGGNMLDRGVTLPGLAVTYITRWSKETQADTVEQRARWFGYKRKYLDVCRVFAPGAVVKGFSDLLGHEDDLWASLRRWEAAGQEVETWPRLFELGEKGDKMRPTRPSVARSRELKDKWLTQSRPEIDPSVSASNIVAVQAFFNSHPNARMEQFGSIQHRVIRDCDPDDLVYNLLNKLSASQSTWRAGYLRELLARYTRSPKFTGLDVVWVALTPQGKTRTRSLGANGAIRNLMQGSNPPPNAYPGDRKIHGNRVQLQVHTIELRDDDGNMIAPQTVALALHLPEGTSKRLVTRDEK